MVDKDKGFTLHPYDTDAIEFPEDYTRRMVPETTSNNLFLQYAADKKLRDDNPALKEAWERYQVLLTLLREDNNENI